MPSAFDSKEKGPYDGLNISDTIELLKGGADLEATDSNFNTPLINACCNPWGVTSHAEEILLLGANINAQGRAENTALCMAAICGNSPLCKLLIDAGADVSICNHDGDNVLFLAAAKGLTDICMLLIETGKIDKNCRNTKFMSREHGATALMCAANGPRTGANCSSQPETCKALLGAGIDVNLTDELGQTALLYAVGDDRPNAEETAKILMEAGANLNIETGFGTNALWRAGYSGLKDICKLIIEQGGDKPITGEYTKNYCNSAVKEAGKTFTHGGRGGITKPYTALMVAASDAAALKDPEDWSRKQWLALINVLVEAGSDINAATEMGTAWSIAKDWDNQDVMKLLVELGANPQ